MGLTKTCKCGCDYISQHTLTECLNCKKFERKPKEKTKTKAEIQYERMKALGLAK